MESDQNFKDERLAAILAIKRGFIEEWNQMKFPVIQDTGDLYNYRGKLEPEMIQLILEWLPKISDEPNSQETLVRALGKAKKPFNFTVLINLFDSPGCGFIVKWVIGNTISIAAPSNTEEVKSWLKNKLSTVRLGKENEMLMYAVAKYFEYETAVDMLRKKFENFPLHVSDALIKIGTNEDLEFLKEKVDGFKRGSVKTNIGKAIKKLEKKLPNSKK